MRVRVLIASIAVAGSVFLAACDEDLSTLTGPTPSLEPTFSSIQKEIFDTTDASGRTACIVCHTAAGRQPSGGLNLTAGNSYANLVGVSSLGRPGVLRVSAGNPPDSYIVRKLDGGPDIAGVRMPRGTGPYLTQGQMLVIRRWIELGAPNN